MKRNIKCLSLYLFVKHDMESKTKGNNKNGKEKCHLGDSFQDLLEHDNVEADVGQLREVSGQV